MNFFQMKRNTYFQLTAILSITYLLLLLSKPLFKDEFAAISGITPEYGEFSIYHLRLLNFLIPMLLISVVEYFRLKVLTPRNKQLATFLWLGTFVPMILFFLSFIIPTPTIPGRYYQFETDESAEAVFSFYIFLAENLNSLLTLIVLLFGITQLIRVGELVRHIWLKKVLGQK